jgi:hypothetical protein
VVNRFEVAEKGECRISVGANGSGRLFGLQILNIAPRTFRRAFLCCRMKPLYPPA